MDGVNVEIDKPREGVLVHGVNVREVCNAKEQDAGMFSDRPVAGTGLVQFLLCLLGDLLLLRDLIREDLTERKVRRGL